MASEGLCGIVCRASGCVLVSTVDAGSLGEGIADGAGETDGGFSIGTEQDCAGGTGQCALIDGSSEDDVSVGGLEADLIIEVIHVTAGTPGRATHDVVEPVNCCWSGVDNLLASASDIEEVSFTFETLLRIAFSAVEILAGYTGGSEGVVSLNTSSTGSTGAVQTI